MINQRIRTIARNIAGVVLLAFIAAPAAAQDLKRAHTEPRVVVEPEKPPQEIIIDPVIHHPERAKVRIWTDERSYNAGDEIRVYFKANFDGYVYIFNTDTEGVTRQIFPNYFDEDNDVQANYTYSIPRRGYRLRITGPKGTESLTVVAYPERWTCFSAYHRFESDDPYPLRDGGAKAMLQTFERETEKRRKAYLRGQLHSDNDEPDAHKGKSGKETEDRDEDSWPDTDSPPLKRGVVVESVEVEPVPIHKWREPWYVEDHTTFRVYDYPTAQLRSGRLDVRTWPDGARVYLDGRYVGITPLSLENLREGRYHLKLTKRGYENVSQEIIIQRTRSTVVREHLSPERGRPLRPDRGDDDGGWNGRLDIDLSW